MVLSLEKKHFPTVRVPLDDFGLCRNFTSARRMLSRDMTFSFCLHLRWEPPAVFSKWPKSRTQKTILDQCQTDHSHIWFDEHTELAATCGSVIATNIPTPHLFEMLRRKESPTFAPSCKAYERRGGNPLSYEQNTSVDGFCWGGVWIHSTKTPILGKPINQLVGQLV